MGVGAKLVAASQFIRLWLLGVAPVIVFVGAIADLSLGLLMAIALLKRPTRVAGR